MKHAQQPWKKTGLCHICGKPTRLLIHAECGKKVDAAKKAKIITRIVTEAGQVEFNQQQQENSKRNNAQRRYLKGIVPKIFYD